MIHIIKKGTKEVQECPKCGCVFSYDAEEDVIKNSTQFYFSVSIDCPQCGKKIYLKETKDFES